MNKSGRFKSICCKVDFLMAGVISAVLLLCVYAVRGIYPFGSENVSYYDMSQSLVPAAYYVYDFFHGNVGMWLNWQLGAGASTAETIGNTILSPFNLLLIFASRSRILEFMSWIVLFKVSACAVSMSFYSKKTFSKLGLYWYTILGLLYASGGFVLQYYTSIHFLDIVALFPLIVYGCDQLLNEQRPLLYVLFMAVGFINNFQMMSMVCWFVILYSAYPVARMSKEKRMRVCYFLGIATIIAICISACISFPVLSVLFSSGRADLGVDRKLEQIFGIFINADKNAKFFMLYGCEIGIAAMLYKVIEKKSNIKELIHYLIMFALLIIPIPFEMVNRNWHIGGYVQFPMRFAYMLTFIGLCLFGRSLLISSETNEIKLWRRYAGLISIAGIPFLIIALLGFADLFAEYGIRDDGNFKPYWSVFLIIIVVSFFAFLLIDKKAKYAALALVVVSQFMVGWFGFLAPKYEAAPECTDSIIINSELLRSELHIEDDNVYNFLNRVKDSSISMNSNYGEVVGRSSLASFSYGINPDMISLLRNLGYNNIYIRTCDGGGTAFSDALFHVGTLISYEEMDDFLYEVERVVENYYLHKAKYLYPFGTVISQYDFKDRNICVSESVFDNQNKIFSLIENNHEELIEKSYIDTYLKDMIYDEEIEMYIQKYDIPIKCKSELYLSLPEDNSYSVWVNEKMLIFHDLENPDNYNYPGYFVNGLIDLGGYEQETIELKIFSTNMLKENSIEIGKMSIEKLSASIESQMRYERKLKVCKNGLEMKLDGVERNKLLLLPIAELHNYHITVNGKRMNSETLDGALVVVPLDEGENIIKLHYIPRGLLLGICVSCVGICALVLICKKNESLSINYALSRVFMHLYFLVLGCVIVYMYIYPILYTIYMRVKYSGM